ncbi:hypothetical protein IW140_001332 [Coemansia sp. RSA 1813]|nr:hypothetical protein EV178_000976 [Coemansia sp. RSA 1646]KAJ2212461.1 hypothetical protein EV179_004643 [Coemansia sp. RSA 487]KAJ2571691.1 hypothetical protein IW140_001332 [Coemansia sp. RSA 1813]
MAIRHSRFRHRQIESYMNSKPEIGAADMQSTVLEAEGASAAGNQRLSTNNAFYFDQNVDHFGANSSTFKQRFYINGNEYTQDGPIYLFNSGETPASPSYLVAGEPYTLARETGGMVVIMEHRYYGVSYPVSDMSGPNMKYLTLENTLEDIAYFINSARGFINQSTGISISPKSKWIVVGGSYSANIAVWMRMLYPNLVFAAYASSAPLLASTDFYQYDQVVGRALPCAPQISQAIETLDAILDYGNRGLIDSWKRAFGLGALQNDSDFAGALTDQMAGTVQYYVPPPQGSSDVDTVSSLCSWFGHTNNNPLQNMADMTAAYIRNNGIDPVTAYSSGSGATNYNIYQDGRSWFYQVCTQFGYWQTAPPAPLQRLRSKYVTASWQSAPCRQFFGNDVTGIPDVAWFNRKYRGLLPNVTRVVFVNGLLDPWSQLSVSVDTDVSKRVINEGDNVVITMHRASHVADFYLSSSRTDFGINLARKDILSAIKKFLAQA